MRRRKLVIALAAAALFGAVVVPASAELHRVTVTLITGQTLTMTVDVPPGASVESISIPGLPAPVQSITDLGPVATPTPVPTAVPTVPPAPQVPAPASGAADPSSRVTTRAPTAAARSPPGTDKGSGAGKGDKGDPRRRRRWRGRPELRSPERHPRAGDQARQEARRPLEPDAQHGRIADARQPDRLARHSGRGPHRRPELLHREVPHPAVPAPDLPGGRHRVRRPLGGARGDQRDRDRLRPQPQRLLRRRPRLDAVHAADLEDVRRRRQPGRRQGPVQPGRRDLRRRALPARRRRRPGPARGDLRLQPRRLVRRLGHPARALHRWPARRSRRLALRAHAGPLPGPGQGGLREGRHAQGRQEVQGGREPRVRDRVQLAAQGDQDLRPRRRPGRRRERRPHRPDRGEPPARQVRRAAGRLRQHLHVRAPQERRQVVPDAQAAARSTSARSHASCNCRHAMRRPPARPRSRPRPRRRRARPPRPTPPPSRAGTPTRLPPRSACSPTPIARTPLRPAASSSPTCARRASAAT